LFKCAIVTTCISLNLQNIHGEENGAIEDIESIHDDDSADDVHCRDDNEEEVESLSDEECGMLYANFHVHIFIHVCKYICILS